MDKEITKKQFSKNFHAGRLDLNIVYGKRKAFQARFIDGLHKMIMARMVENKAAQDQLDAFDAKIHTAEGKLTLKDLGKLNSVYKR